MDEGTLKDLLVSLKDGKVSIDDCLQKLKSLPFENIDFACIDHHRNLRKGAAEVIYGEGKEADDIIAIMERMTAQGDNILITRLSQEKAEKVKGKYPESEYNKRAGIITFIQQEKEPDGRGTILVISAGTSDLPVAEEAAITARFLGNRVETLYDIGVSGLHRMLGNLEIINSASIIIVVAGMEGALPSVVGGLVNRPVIAVPTSVGYGASFGGIAALLGMLNTCASGVTVVNIDNGFGAGYAASLMNRT